MKIYDVEQNSDEWYALRCGVLTSSSFDKILTPGGKLSTQAGMIENRIVAERLTGDPIIDFKGTQWTERGHELEPDAVSFYEFKTGSETHKVGFVLSDDGTIGCSPDRFVGEDGILEIKCPAPHTHVEMVLTGKIGEEYKPQIQGQLLITGRSWVDIVSYHPKIKPSIIRVERDAEYIDKLANAIEGFNHNVRRKLDAFAQ